MMRLPPRWRSFTEGRRAGYTAALLLTAIVTVFIGVVIARVSIGNISMVYLLAVLAVAAQYGMGPAILASVAAFIAFDWFFIEPIHTFVVADAAEWLALLLFLVAAVITGGLASELRRRAQVAEQREREAAVLYDVVRLMAEMDVGQALQLVAERLRQELRVDAVGFDLFDSGRTPMRIVAGMSEALPEPQSSPQGVAALLSKGTAPTRDHPGVPGRWVRVIPPHKGAVADRGLRQHLHAVALEAQGQRAGLLYLAHPTDAPEFGPADDRLLSAVAGQVGLAVERRRLRLEATEAEVLRHTDALKTALLNAVSHDLRTPLASILASAGALLQREVEWSSKEVRDFALAIEHETRRLNQLVGNLLDLSRIEAGNLLIEKGWYSLSVLVDEVLGRLRPLTLHHNVVVRIPEDLPPVQLGYVEIDQVLSNLIENASKYAPAGTEIQISAARDGETLRVEVSDEGPGIPAESIPKLFEPFYRVLGEGTRPRGSGLGLGVAKGLVDAHGGRIWAENRPGGGASFIFTLPMADTGRAGRARELRQ